MAGTDRKREVQGQDLLLRKNNPEHLKKICRPGSELGRLIHDSVTGACMIVYKSFFIFGVLLKGYFGVGVKSNKTLQVFLRGRQNPCYSQRMMVK